MVKGKKELQKIPVEEGSIVEPPMFSDAQILSMLSDALFVGDFGRVDLCEKAISGDQEAIDECQKIYEKELELSQIRQKNSIIGFSP